MRSDGCRDAPSFCDAPPPRACGHTLNQRKLFTALYPPRPYLQNYVEGDVFGVQVATCGKLITGQNPPSAKPTAEAIIAALEVAKMAPAAATVAATAAALPPPPPDEGAAPSPLRRSSDPPPPADDGLRFSSRRPMAWTRSRTPSPVDGAAVAVTDAVNAAASATGDTLASLVFGVGSPESPKGESSTEFNIL